MSVSHEIRFYKKNAQRYIASENFFLDKLFWWLNLGIAKLWITNCSIIVVHWKLDLGTALDCIIVCKHPFWMNETGAFGPLRTFFKYFVENLENSVDNLLDFDFQKHTMGFQHINIVTFIYAIIWFYHPWTQYT
jgi:hypothetical protein